MTLSDPRADGDGASLSETLDKLKLSTDEVGKFEKAFKDPEFIKIFEQYAKDMQDPETRAETNQYLQQLEREGQIEQVYGKGTQLITPTPEFVVKTKEATGTRKVFLNVCSSDKVCAHASAHLTLHAISSRSYPQTHLNENLRPQGIQFRRWTRRRASKGPTTKAREASRGAYRCRCARTSAQERTTRGRSAL